MRLASAPLSTADLYLLGTQVFLVGPLSTDACSQSMYPLDEPALPLSYSPLPILISA